MVRKGPQLWSPERPTAFSHPGPPISPVANQVSSPEFGSVFQGPLVILEALKLGMLDEAFLSINSPAQCQPPPSPLRLAGSLPLLPLPPVPCLLPVFSQVMPAVGGGGAASEVGVFPPGGGAAGSSTPGQSGREGCTRLPPGSARSCAVARPLPCEPRSISSCLSPGSLPSGSWPASPLVFLPREAAQNKPLSGMETSSQ